MYLKKYKFQFVIISLIFFEIFICIFSINKGASNTDEFTTLLNLRFQETMVKVDFYNMLYILSDVFFNKITVLTFRETKFIFILISLSTSCLLLFPVLKEKFKTTSNQLFLIAFIMLTASITTAFNRAICYNDVMDHFSVLAVCVLFNLLFFAFNWLRLFVLTAIYLVCTFFLFGIKFPLGVFAILVFIFSVYRFLPITFFQKTSIIIGFLVVFMLIEYCYIQHFYHHFFAWLQTYDSLRKVFYDEDPPIYIIDVIGFLLLFAILFFFHKKINNFISTALLKISTNFKIQLSITIVFTLFFAFYFILLKSKALFVLYYLFPSVLLICFLIYAYTNITITFFIQRKIAGFNKMENYIILIAIGFFACCLLGSYTLQLINVMLHPYMVGFLFIIILIKQQDILLLKSVSVYLFILFIVYSVFNPFLYSNTTLFHQNKKIYFKASDEFLYVNDATKKYFENISTAIGCCDRNTNIVNIDFTNVAYYLGYAPYLLPNIADEQSATIFRNELQAIRSMHVKQAPEPKWMLASNTTDTNFYLHLKNDRQLEKDSLVLKIEDPASNVFKSLKSDGSLYIYTIKHTEK